MVIEKYKYSYENLYYNLWELSQRYHSFTEFRIIGKSHDDRMIPMIEVGKGNTVIFCISGFWGTDCMMPWHLYKIIKEYCNLYECEWMLDDLYDTKDLLNEIRICFIPLINPDGYEIHQKGYSTIKNPIFRQMLKMMNVPSEEYYGNARNVNIYYNFPTSNMKEKRRMKDPGSENETKSIMRIFKEYDSNGVLFFCHAEKKIIYYKQNGAVMYNQRNHNLAHRLQHHSNYRLEKRTFQHTNIKEANDINQGSIAQYFTEQFKQPVIQIEIPCSSFTNTDHFIEKNYRELRSFPLRFIFSLLYY